MKRFVKERFVRSVSPEVVLVGLILRNTSGDTDVSGESAYGKRPEDTKTSPQHDEYDRI